AMLGATLGFAFSPVGEDNAATTDGASILSPDLEPTDDPSGLTPTGSPSPTSSPSPSPSPSVDPALAPTAAAPAPAPAPAAQPPAPAPAAPPPGGGGGRVPGGMSGIAAGSLSQVRAWEAFRGSPVDVVVAFSGRGSWQEIT
nr:hypothetical protein [Micromonospora sp. DSM 115978]